VRLKHIPNALTLFRLSVIPPFLLFLYYAQYELAFFTFILAGLSDALDGWLARHYQWQTRFGFFLDPFADKLLVAASFIALALLQQLPWWLVVLVFLRDFNIMLGIVVWHFVMQRSIDFSATWISKLNTTLQLIIITLCLFELAYYQFPSPFMTIWIYLTALTTGISYLDYARIWIMRACTESEKQG
jgi:cardiolipin synthase